MKKYVFGYGSLMNPRSMQKTLPDKTAKQRVGLIGYQRKFNFAAEGHLFLNIVPRDGFVVKGVLVSVTNEELKRLKRREVGYDCVEVSDKVVSLVKGHVFSFIAPDKNFPNLKILRSYLNTCLGGLPREERTKWIEETIIESEIEEDMDNPKYRNADLSSLFD